MSAMLSVVNDFKRLMQIPRYEKHLSYRETKRTLTDVKWLELTASFS